MADASAAPSPAPIRSFDVFASLVVAFELAVAQPLLDLLGRNAEFFVARSSPASDVIAFVIGLAVVVPLVGAALVLLVRRMHRPTGNVLHLVGVSGLFGLLGIQIARRLPAPVAIGAGLIVGCAIALLYVRAHPLRRVFRFAVALPLVVVGLALFGSSLSKLVLGDAVPAGVPGVVIGDPAPVVFVAFDEFPLASLLDDRYRIDGRLYPNFARLAGDATWFRNATAVGEFTDKAMPAILTGQFPDNTKLPIVQDHPRNLFTLLGRSHVVRAQEPITRLCPLAVCGETAPRIPAGSRWRSLLSDMRVIALHVMLPVGLTDGLPPINRGWGGFAAQARGGLAKTYTADQRGEALRANFHAAVDQDRRAAFEAFIDSIERTERRTVWFSHAILPHGPWEFLPGGHNFPSPDGLPGRTKGNRWSDDAWLTAQAYKAHLLQTQYVDTLIGKMIDKLEHEGLYDESLIVITADHGGAFTPGLPRRSVAVPRTVGEIAYVPLFVKKPGQQRGEISDTPVYTMDVLPTVADVLGVEGLWKTDGRSAYSVPAGSRPLRMLNNNSGRILHWPTDEALLRDAVRRKYATFARDGHSLDPWRTRPYGELVGHDLRRFTVSQGPAGSIAPLGREDGSAPSVVTGSVSAPASSFMALAVDGVVRSITRIDGDRFGFLLPEGSIRRGNTIDVFVVESDDRLRLVASATYAR